MKKYIKCDTIDNGYYYDLIEYTDVSSELFDRFGEDPDEYDFDDGYDDWKINGENVIARDIFFDDSTTVSDVIQTLKKYVDIDDQWYSDHLTFDWVDIEVIDFYDERTRYPLFSFRADLNDPKNQ